MYYCYIIYSQVIDKFYIGSTILKPSSRLDRHLSEYYGLNKYTSKAIDYILFFSLECQSLSQARKIETHIKKMKSRRQTLRHCLIYWISK